MFANVALDIFTSVCSFVLVLYPKQVCRRGRHVIDCISGFNQMKGFSFCIVLFINLLSYTVWSVLLFKPFRCVNEFVNWMNNRIPVSLFRLYCLV